MGHKSSFFGLPIKEWPRCVTDIQAYMDTTFATISSRYDFMTRVLSFGQEQRWKRKAINFIPRDRGHYRLLDLACGTGDFPFHLHHAGFKVPIFGLDRNLEMLGLSMRKCAGQPQIHFIQGDLNQIPFKDHSFDVITMGYGLRYVADIRQILEEVYRLLSKGGIFVCLEFGVPKNLFYRRLCLGYLFLFGTLWGLVLHRKKDIYWHIVESLKAYPGQEIVRKWLQEVGFGKIELHEQLRGIIAILSGIRSLDRSQT